MLQSRMATLGLQALSHHDSRIHVVVALTQRCTRGTWRLAAVAARLPIRVRVVEGVWCAADAGETERDA